MNKIRTILIKKDIINSDGAIVIPKGKLLRLDEDTIDKLKLHRVYSEVLDLVNKPLQEKQNEETSSSKKVKEVLVNSNSLSIQTLKDHDPQKFITILGIMTNYLFECRNEEWHLYLSTLSNGYSWYYTHSINVAVIASAIGLNLGYTKEEVHTLILGSLLHDIGIILLPKNLLLKDKYLFTSEEQEIFEKHSSLGYEMVKHLPISDVCKNIILDHHKLLNDGGYPKSGADYKLSKESKIVIVADYFDSQTTSERSGKQTPEGAIADMIRRPEDFPMEIVAILKNVLNL